MKDEKAISIAIKCVAAQMKLIAYAHRRYKDDAKNWPEYRAKYKRYKDMEQSIVILESKRAQKKLW